ncbi:FAD-dependent monooxygenase [Gordonia terrae]|uniref:FAD-dependent monooxygenase n=1 Tax=Gordonia terrae TaxID=2055 RepID=UPI0021515D8A|nr:FAD-dependent monooxygenase [Gordonia terrae]
MSIRTEHFDAVIVGARCAGAATAIALATRGSRVLLIDSARFPSDTLSTHLLWPSTMAEIHALGALPAVEDAAHRVSRSPRPSSTRSAGAPFIHRSRASTTRCACVARTSTPPSNEPRSPPAPTSGNHVAQRR